MTRPLIIFDLDGTLVDSNRDLVPALNHATFIEGIPPISRDDVGHVVGQGALRMIDRAYAFHGETIEFGGELHMRLLDRFLDYYEAHIADETVFYPGVIEQLDRLSENGWQFAVCTNKYESLARKLLSELNELDRFVAVTGGDTFSVKKPDPAHILGTIEQAGADRARTIMVGDSINDIAAAQAAGVPVIAVDFGYSDVPVATLSPDIIISHYKELEDAVNKLGR